MTTTKPSTKTYFYQFTTKQPTPFLDIVVKKNRFVEFKVTYILTDLKSQQTWVQKSTFFVDHLGKQAALYSQFTYDLSSSPSSTYLGQITYKTHGSRLVIVIPPITAPHFQWTINVQTTKFKI